MPELLNDICMATNKQCYYAEGYFRRANMNNLVFVITSFIKFVLSPAFWSSTQVVVMCTTSVML